LKNGKFMNVEPDLKLISFVKNYTKIILSLR
jgi:hypothetical protein